MRYQLYIFTLLLPVVVMPVFHSEYSFPKWFVGVIFASSFLIYVSGKRFAPNFSLKMLLIPWIMLILIHLSSIPGSTNQWLGVETTFCITVAMIWALAGYKLLDTEKARANWIKALTLSGLCVSILGFCQILGFDPRTSLHIADPTSTLGHRNYLAQFLIIQIPISFFLVQRASNRVWRFLGLFACLGGLLLLLWTGCRGGWIGLFSGVVLLIAFHLVKSRKVTLKHAAGFVCIFCLLAVVSFGVPQLRGRLISITDVDKGTNRFRVLVWTSTCQMIRDHPLLGVGSGNFKIIYPKYRSVEEIRLSGSDVFVNRSHNDFLETACETGPVGLILHVWILLVTIMVIVRNQTNCPLYANCVFVALSSTIIHSLFSMNFRNPVPLLMISVLVGSMSAHRGKTTSSDYPVKQRLFQIPIVFLGCAAVLACMLRIPYEVSLAKGVSLELREDYKNAVKNFSNAHRRWVGDYLGGYHAGFCYSKLEDPEKALRYTESSLQNHPYFFNLLFNKGVILEKLKKYQDALEAYRSVLHLNPIYPDGWNNLGYLYAKLERLEESQFAFEQAVDTNPWTTEFNRNLGIIYLKQGKLDQTTSSFEKGLRTARCLNFDRSTTRHFASLGAIQFRAATRTIDDNSANSFSNWGYVRFPPRPESPPEIQNPEKLIAVRYDPDRKELLLECEYNAKATGYIIEYKVRGYSGAVELNPIQPVFADLWNSLGVTYEASGNLSKAEESYKQAVFTQPDHRSALKNLKRVSGI